MSTSVLTRLKKTALFRMLRFFRTEARFRLKQIRDVLRSCRVDRYAKEDSADAHPLSWWETHLNHQLIREYGPRIGERVLDIGCGSAAITILAARCGHDATGIDLNVSALIRANQLLANEPAGVAPRVNLCACLLQELPFGAETFDGGLMFDVLEHIYPRDRARVLGAIQHVMRDGACILIVTPLERAYLSSAHVAFFTPRSLRRILLHHGFEVLSCEIDERQDAHEKHHRINALVQVHHARHIDE